MVIFCNSINDTIMLHKILNSTDDIIYYMFVLSNMALAFKPSNIRITVDIIIRVLGI